MTNHETKPRPYCRASCHQVYNMFYTQQITHPHDTWNILTQSTHPQHLTFWCVVVAIVINKCLYQLSSHWGTHNNRVAYDVPIMTATYSHMLLSHALLCLLDCMIQSYMSFWLIPKNLSLCENKCTCWFSFDIMGSPADCVITWYS